MTTHDAFGGGSFDAPLSDQETGNIAFKISRNSSQDLLLILGNGNVGDAARKFSGTGLRIAVPGC